MQGDEKGLAELTERMKQLLQPFVLRRLKTEVADQLTRKSHATEFVEMTGAQVGGGGGNSFLFRFYNEY